MSVNSKRNEFDHEIFFIDECPFDTFESKTDRNKKVKELHPELKGKEFSDWVKEHCWTEMCRW